MGGGGVVSELGGERVLKVGRGELVVGAMCVEGRMDLCTCVICTTLPKVQTETHMHEHTHTKRKEDN